MIIMIIVGRLLDVGGEKDLRLITRCFLLSVLALLNVGIYHVMVSSAADSAGNSSKTNSNVDYQ